MVEVIYSESGFGNVIGQLLEQKLKDPKRAEIAKKMKGKIFLEVRDMGVGATVEFGGGRVEVKNERPQKDFALISVADYNTLASLSSSGILKQLKLVVTGKLKIKNFGFARKFGALIS
jgi:predicted lipid carrier protein YhbT